MTSYWPTLGCLRGLAEHGINWPDVAVALETRTETVTPCRGYETRVRVYAASFQAYCEPVRLDGEDGFVVVGVRKRLRPDCPTRPVVGVEPDTPVRRGHGGSGTRWPTTWDELRSRIEALPGVRLEQTSKHVGVFRGAAKVATLPTTASDHRSLLNMCQTLRSLGIDVSRRPGTTGSTQT